MRSIGGNDHVMARQPGGSCHSSELGISAVETALDRYERERLGLRPLLLPDSNTLLAPPSADDRESARHVVSRILAALTPDTELERLKLLCNELRAMVAEPADLVPSGAKAAVYDDHFRVKRIPDNARTALAISSTLAMLAALDNIEELGSSVDSVVVGELVRGVILVLGAIQFEAGGAQ